MPFPRALVQIETPTAFSLILALVVDSISCNGNSYAELFPNWDLKNILKNWLINTNSHVTNTFIKILC